MSVLHRVEDIYELDGPTFFRLAYRLPAYSGAAKVDLEGWLEDIQEEERKQIERQATEGLPPRYVYDEVEDVRESQVPMPTVKHEDRAATLDELLQAGPPMPMFGELAPIFEIAIPTE
jgi:hypothetical protein